MRDDFDEKEFAKFDDWCERKALERHERYLKAKAEREKAGAANAVTPGGDTTSASYGTPGTGHAQPSVTSDPKYEEAF